MSLIVHPNMEMDMTTFLAVQHFRDANRLGQKTALYNYLMLCHYQVGQGSAKADPQFQLASLSHISLLLPRIAHNCPTHTNSIARAIRAAIDKYTLKEQTLQNISQENSRANIQLSHWLMETKGDWDQKEMWKSNVELFPLPDS